MWIPRWHILLLAAAVAPMSFPADPPADTPKPSDESKGEMRKGIFRGRMVGFEGSVNAGVLLARNAEGDVYGCGYDSRSYFEYQHRKTSVAKLEPGDPLEILTDHKPGSVVCYVRMAEVVPPPPLRPARKDAAVPTKPVIALPKGDRTISGMVIRLERGTVTLRTRAGEEATLLLRADTVYQQDGLRMDASALSVNDRVSVRAGVNARRQVEAYQVIWGDILVVP